jgi:hypothetical protein
MDGYIPQNHMHFTPIIHPNPKTLYILHQQFNHPNIAPISQTSIRPSYYGPKFHFCNKKKNSPRDYNFCPDTKRDSGRCSFPPCSHGPTTLEIRFMLPKRSTGAGGFGNSGISVEPYLFLSASRPSGPLFWSLIAWPQKDENSAPIPPDRLTAKSSFSTADSP